MLVTLTVATFSGPPSEEEPERSSSFQGQRHGITPPPMHLKRWKRKKGGRGRERERRREDAA